MTTISGQLINASNSSLQATSANSPVASTTNRGLVQTAVDLSSAASAIASLGQSGTSLQTYTAAGLLNSLVQAEQSSTTSISVFSTGSDTDTQAVTQQSGDSTDQGDTGTSASPATTSSSTTSGIYNSAGALQGSTDLSSNWASILKSNPNAASTAIKDSVTQGIVATLATTA